MLVLIVSELPYREEAIQSSFTHPVPPRTASTHWAALQSLDNPQPGVTGDSFKCYEGQNKSHRSILIWF